MKPSQESEDHDWVNCPRNPESDGDAHSTTNNSSALNEAESVFSQGMSVELCALLDGNDSTQWWKWIDGEDPITIEPIKELAFAPFQLNASQRSAYWFDASALAHYLISTLNFSHPISRRQLSREECLDLDRHLLLHYSEQLGVVEAFDHRADLIESDRIHHARESSRRVLESIFGIRPNLPLPPLYEATQNLPLYSGPGEPLNLRIYDDDTGEEVTEDWPSLAGPSIPGVQVSTQATTSKPASAWGSKATPATALFSDVTDATLPLCRQYRPSPSPAVTPKDTVRVVKMTLSDHSLLEAPQVHPELDPTRAPSFLLAWTEPSLGLAAEEPCFLSSVETLLAEFVENVKEDIIQLEPLSRRRRTLVHEVATKHGLCSRDLHIRGNTNPCLVIEKIHRVKSCLPPLALSQAVSDPVAYRLRLWSEPTALVFSDLAPGLSLDELLTRYEGLYRLVVHDKRLATVLFANDQVLSDVQLNLGAGIRGSYRIQKGTTIEEVESTRRHVNKGATGKNDARSNIPKEPQATWQCEVCTLLNSWSAFPWNCEACESPNRHLCEVDGEISLVTPMLNPDSMHNRFHLLADHS